MKAELIINNNNQVRGSHLELCVIETLILSGALRNFIENPKTHRHDKAVALCMLEDLHRIMKDAE